MQPAGSDLSSRLVLCPPGEAQAPEGRNRLPAGQRQS